MTNKKTNNKTLLLMLLVTMGLFKTTNCWGWPYWGLTCDTLQMCMKYGHMTWMYYQKWLHPVVKISFSRHLSVTYWRKIYYNASHNLPILWYYTIPIRGFKKYKPWSTWNHPQYYKYNKRRLEEEELDNPDDMNQELVFKEFKEVLEKSKFNPKKDIYNCSSVDDCIQKACHGALKDSKKISVGHHIMKNFYQNALQVAFNRLTGKRMELAYFELKCFDDISKNMKLDLSNVDIGQKVAMDSVMEEGTHEIFEHFSQADIPGFNEFAFNTDPLESANGSTLDSYNGNSLSNSSDDTTVTVIPPMIDEVF